MGQKVKFIHNPFKNKTDFFLNGDNFIHGKYPTFSEQRLQMWISQFFQVVADSLQTKEFFVDFTGVPSDCADVEEAIQQANASGFKITYQFTQIRSQNERIWDLEKLVKEIRENPILNQIIPEEEWNDAMDKYFDAWVIATMSSGKSTFINALLGSKVLPAFQEDTTASITEIIDDKKFAQGEFSASRFNEKGGELNKDLELNLLTPEQADKSRAILAEWNADTKNQEKPENERTNLIELKGNVSGVQERANVQLRITDTPGANTDKSNASQHALTSRKMLKDELRNPLVLYVLRGDNLSVNDDNTFLSEMSSIMKEKGKLAQDRFIFIVNKMDVFFNKDESIEATLNRVRNYLSKFGIKNPYIFPVCSLLALELKNQQLNPALLSEDTQDDIDGLSKKINRKDERDLNQYMPLSEKVKNRLTEKQLAPELYRTGIPAVELVIDEYISKYHVIYRIERIQEVITDLLRRAYNSDAYKVALEDIKGQEEQLKHAIQYLNDSEEKEKSIQNYIDSLNAVNIIPENIINSFKNESRILEEEFAKWEKEFNIDEPIERELSPKLDKVSTGIRWACEEIVFNLTNGIERAQNEMIETLKKGYQEYISRFFNEVPNLDLKVIKGFENHLKNFDVQLVITPQYIKTERQQKIHEESGFFAAVKRFFNMGGYEKITESRNFVDMKSLWKDQQIKLRAEIGKIIPDAYNSVIKYAEEIMDTYIKQLDHIFKPELERLTQELFELTQDKEKREEEIKRAKSNIDVIKKYQARLDEIIEV